MRQILVYKLKVRFVLLLKPAKMQTICDLIQLSSLVSWTGGSDGGAREIHIDIH